MIDRLKEIVRVRRGQRGLGFNDVSLWEDGSLQVRGGSEGSGDGGGEEPGEVSFSVSQEQEESGVIGSR